MDVYTDGACTKNGQVGARAASAIWIPSTGHRDTKVMTGKATNNVAELTAIKMALEQTEGPIRIITDSQLCMNTFTTWIHNWIRKGIVHTKANSELIMEIYNLMRDRQVTFRHVNSHLTIAAKAALSAEDRVHVANNEIVDGLATNALL